MYCIIVLSVHHFWNISVYHRVLHTYFTIHIIMLTMLCVPIHHLPKRKILFYIILLTYFNVVCYYKILNRCIWIKVMRSKLCFKDRILFFSFFFSEQILTTMASILYKFFPRSDHCYYVISWESEQTVIFSGGYSNNNNNY